MAQHEFVYDRPEAARNSVFQQIEKLYEQNRAQSRLLSLTAISIAVFSLLLTITTIFIILISKIDLISIAFIGSGAILLLTNAFLIFFYFPLAREYKKQEDRLARRLVKIESSDKAVQLLLGSNIDSKI